MPRVELPGPPPTGTPAGLAGLAPPPPSTAGLVARATNIPSGAPIRATPNGHTSPELAGSDFVILDEPKKTTVGIVFARDGDGKTHFAVNYCPEPVVVIGLDGRGEREIKKALNRGRRVYYLDAAMPANILQMSHEQAQASADEILRLITRNYEWAIERSIKEWGRGTLVIDTSTELRDIARVSVRGRVDRPQPKKGEGYFVAQTDAVINRALKYFADRARNSNLSLILLSRSKPVYDGREDTGRITWDTDKIFSQAADWTIEYRMVGGNGLAGGLVGGGLVGGVVPMLGVPGVPIVPSAASGPSFEIQATKPKLAIEEMGAVYRQAEWEAEGIGPFAYVCTRLVPGSQPEDWK